MTQRWRSLLFVHFPVEPLEIQKLLPEDLTIDTFPDKAGKQMAWVGLVPFRMEGVTPKGVPEVPGIHAFPETNVRTYVHRGGKEPGVWFFSLEAANTLACKVARRFFHLPYHEAEMTVEEKDQTVTYRSKRRKGGSVCNGDCTFGDDLPMPLPGSFEFFLVERYLLYAYHHGSLFTGRVFHHPYRLKAVKRFSIEQDLTDAALIPQQAFCSFLYSEGVDVEVFPLRRSVR